MFVRCPQGFPYGYADLNDAVRLPEAKLVYFDSVSFPVLQQQTTCYHSGLAYLRLKHNVRIAMHTCVSKT